MFRFKQTAAYLQKVSKEILPQQEQLVCVEYAPAVTFANRTISRRMRRRNNFASSSAMRSTWH